ncbi:hypothetical protein KSP39_PZI017116 [Platanthera zijinensis]|uniref:Uncharacterized protein n=1 Tax=Platanthera zijinensis TaxID=2320716 RepID=A0AAP0B5J0_9ASPA
MGIQRQNLRPASGPIYGFNGAPVSVAGTLTLPVTLGEFPRQVSHDVQFVAVDTESPYNAIFGRPLQTAFQTTFSSSSRSQATKDASSAVELDDAGDD